MAFVEWSDEKYAIGVARVDEQHRRLFELLNELHDAMQEGEGRDVVGETPDTVLDAAIAAMDVEIELPFEE